MNPVYQFFATINSFAPTLLRLLLTAVFAVHAGQRTIGPLGGGGWKGILTQWTAPAPDGFNLPYGLAVVGIFAGGLGAMGLLLGFMTRLAALGIFCVTAAAFFLVRGAGFFAPRGYEYPLTLAGVALALMCCGGGRFSVDRWLTRALLPPDHGRLGGYLGPFH